MNVPCLWESSNQTGYLLFIGLCAEGPPTYSCMNISLENPLKGELFKAACFHHIAFWWAYVSKWRVLYHRLQIYPPLVPFFVVNPLIASLLLSVSIKRCFDVPLV